MKKLLLGLIAIVSVNLPSQAQQRPGTGDKSVTLGINGLQNLGFNANVSRTGSLLYRHYIADDLAIRASANYTLNTTTNSLNDTLSGIKQTTGKRESAFGIAGGIQKSLGDRPRLEPYIGADVILGFNNQRNRTRTEVTNAAKTPGNDQNGDYQQTVNYTATPFALGIAPMFGFNYFITDGIAIGAEFSYGLNMAFGSRGSTEVTRRENGTDQKPVETPTSPSSFNFDLQNMGATNITLSVFF